MNRKDSRAGSCSFKLNILSGASLSEIIIHSLTGY